MGRVCWIGLQQNPNKESTQWTWSDGSALDFGFDDEGEPLSGDDSPWQSEQPALVAEPGSDDTNCVVLSREEEKDGKWGVVSCNELKPTYYALCGMCISTDCAVDCSGDEFAVWPMSEIVKEMEKPSTTQETESAIDTEDLDEDGRSSRSIGEEEEDIDQDVDQETEETKQLDDLDIPEGSTTAPSAAQIRNSEIDDFENTDDSSNDESGDNEDEDETEDIYSNESGDLYESDINEDSEDESKDDSDDSNDDESAAEDESTDVAPDDESDINDDNVSSDHDSDDDKANDSEHSSADDDSKDDIINAAPTSSPTFEIVECIVDADCDGYRMECNKYAQCAQMTSGSGIYDRAGQAGKGRQEQMNVFRSRVIYVDDIRAMLSNPIWLSGVVLLLIGLIVLVARPMYSCWARSEYKRVATQFDVEHGYQSCV